jgi:phosphatidylglycerophosphatase A
VSRNRLVKIAASAFGLGHMPVAPGTWGSLGAVLLFVAVRLLLRPLSRSQTVLAALLALVVIVGFAVCPQAQRVYASEDPGPFVLDEVAGQWLTCLAFWTWGPWASALGAFLGFRLFDIWKPTPVCTAERLPGAWGPMVDDLVAGLYAVGVLWIMHAVGVRPNW